MFPRLRILRVAVAAFAVLSLASCGKSSKSTAPVVPPSLTLGAAVRLFVPPSFTTPAGLDTTASLLATTSLDGSRTGLAVFVSNGRLVDAGQVYLRTQKAGVSDPDSILLVKLAGTLQGSTYVGYVTSPYTTEGIKIPFDGVLSHVWNVKGSSVIPAERSAMIRATEKIMSPVLLSCFLTPLTDSCRRKRCGSGISSVVTITGPIGQLASRDFPLNHWAVRYWRSRAETSLKTV